MTKEEQIEKQEEIINKLESYIRDIRLGRDDLVDFDIDIIKKSHEFYNNEPYPENEEIIGVYKVSDKRHDVMFVKKVTDWQYCILFTKTLIENEFLKNVKRTNLIDKIFND
jgi:hypothetical protein